MGRYILTPEIFMFLRKATNWCWWGDSVDGCDSEVEPDSTGVCL